jgi:hypothetical protein
MPIFTSVKIKTISRYLDLFHWMIMHRRNYIEIEEIKRLLNCCDSTAYRYQKAISELHSFVTYYYTRTRFH